MRWVVLGVLALLVASGCSSPKAAAPAGNAAPAGPAANAPTANVTALHALRFAGDTTEGNMAIQDSFAVTDGCNFGINECPANSRKTYDLTPLVPADVPVELSASITLDGGFAAIIQLKDAETLRVKEGQDRITQTIDETLVRATTGTVTLVVQYYNPDLGNPQQSIAVTGSVHTVTRNNVVPAFLPVAVQLGPGDRINASADGIDQLVVFPPQGPAIRVLNGPYNVTLPQDAPSGTYILFASAEEAIHIVGPANRPLSARLLDYSQTAAVDLASNADTSWDMDVAGQPVLVGITMLSKETAQGTSIMTFAGPYSMAMQSPGKVDVMDGAGDDCGQLPFCDFSLISSGSGGWEYPSSFLDEHLVPGAYHATVTMKTGNNMQAYSWAYSVRAAA